MGNGRRVSVRPTIARLRAYRPGDGASGPGASNGRVRLDWNEGSRPPSPAVMARLRAFLEGGRLNRYPDPTAARLRRAIAAYARRPVSGVQVFNGSDAALDCLVRTFVAPGDHVVISAPCYDQFRVFAEAAGAAVQAVRGKDPFEADVQPLASSITPATRLVYVCNPNNPTGRTHSRADLRRLLAALGDGLLVVDEAYYEFYGRTAAPLIDADPRVTIVRSFSKAFGLAGLRCGYLLAAPEVVAAVNRLRNGKDVNALAQVAAIAALADIPYMRESVTEMRRNRALLAGALRSAGWRVVVTPANFILLECASPSAVAARLERRGIFVRDRSDLPQLERYVRVTVGTADECRRLVAALEGVRPE
ncbi:MAG: histidinol-phosphate transaminase [Acidobacteria bacterium]|nr:histidinol-phosphate transaminase [Acidobacteriota bacterium]